MSTVNTVSDIPVEFDTSRKLRTRNKLYYRFLHWPIWIFVFFIAPGPLTFDLFERGFDARMALWLGAVLVGTGIAGLRGRAARCRAEAVHHPLHRGPAQPALPARVLHRRVERGRHLCRPQHRRPPRRDRVRPVDPEADLLVGVLPDGGHHLAARRARAPAALHGRPRRARATSGGTSTARCGRCRSRSRSCGSSGRRCRAVSGPTSPSSAIFVGVLAAMGYMAYRGRLPRTRPIVPGEWAVSD